VGRYWRGCKRADEWNVHRSGPKLNRSEIMLSCIHLFTFTHPILYIRAVLDLPPCHPQTLPDNLTPHLPLPFHEPPMSRQLDHQHPLLLPRFPLPPHHRAHIQMVMLELGSRLARYETATFGATASKELGGHASAVLFDSLGVVELDCGVGETA